MTRPDTLPDRGQPNSEGTALPFAAAMQAARLPMTITDPHRSDNPIVFANDAFLRLTGYVRSEVEGRNCRFLQGADTDPGRPPASGTRSARAATSASTS
ncbi:PAS domain-containing protein [Methylobacterium gregans]|uniref:PAS domain-containing protein n=1 Tax=Methylobacterium gregans TaxID=374424 RepID=UPI0036140E84